jgi:hypothetical protein
MAIPPTDIRILFANYDIIAYFLNLAFSSEHFISIKHRILATFNINKNKFHSDSLYAFKLSHFPVLPSTVSMYLTSLIQTGVSVAVLNSIFYAVKWYHNMFLFEDPCVNRLVKLVSEGGKRILSKPIKKKEPVTVDVIVKLYNFYKGRLDLFNSRSLCMFVLAYAGFFLDIKKFQI